MSRPTHLLTALILLVTPACGDSGAGPVEPDATHTGSDGGGAGGDGLVPDDPEAAGWVESLYGLPTIAVWANPDDLDEIHEKFDDDIPITVAIQMPEGIWEDVTFELHGGYARTVPKKTYRVIFPDGESPELDLFGDGDVGEHRRFVLNASWIDPTFARNKLTMDLLRDVGTLSPRLAYRALLLNGAFHGLYVVTERIDKPWVKRQDFDKDGNLYKAENHQANWLAKSDPLDGFEMEINSGNPTDDLGELLDTLTYTPATWEDFQAEVAPRLSLEDFMRWQLVHTLAMNTDTFTKNYYLYHDIDASPGSDDDQFRIISWDADATWGITWDGTAVDTSVTSWHGTDTFAPRLFGIDAYKDQYVGLYESVLADEADPSTLEVALASISSTIRSAVLADFELWERTEDFDEAVSDLGDALELRHDVMSGVLEGL